MNILTKTNESSLKAVLIKFQLLEVVIIVLKT